MTIYDPHRPRWPTRDQTCKSLLLEEQLLHWWWSWPIVILACFIYYTTLFWTIHYSEHFTKLYDSVHHTILYYTTLHYDFHWFNLHRNLVADQHIRHSSCHETPLVTWCCNTSDLGEKLSILSWLLFEVVSHSFENNCPNCWPKIDVQLLCVVSTSNFQVCVQLLDKEDSKYIYSNSYKGYFILEYY